MGIERSSSFSDMPRPGRRHHDRHGRGVRGDLIPPHLPGYRSRRDLFDEAVLDAAEPLLDRFPKRLEHLEVAVEDVPGTDPAPWEDALVTLGRLFPADRDHPPRIVLYRRPIETRCHEPGEMELMLRQILADHVATLLGTRPEEVDPDIWPEP